MRKERSMGFWFSVLYNPIIPVYLYEKQIWTIVNIVTAVVFIMKKDALNEAE